MNPRIRFLVGVTLLTSCTVNRYVYRANPVNLPGLTEAGDSRVTVSAGGNGSLDNGPGMAGVDIQAAYAVSKHITLLGGYSGRRGTNEGLNTYDTFQPGPPSVTDSAYIQYRNNTWELGAAYMIRFGRHVYMSLGAGGGGGDYHIDDGGGYNGSLYRYFLDARQGSWYIEPAMYFKYRYVDFGVGFKVTGTHYSGVRTTYPDSSQVFFSVNGLNGNDMNMWQPFVLLRVRPYLSWLQLELQCGFNVGGNAKQTGTTYYYDYVNGSIGLSIDPTRLLQALRR